VFENATVDNVLFFIQKTSPIDDVRVNLLRERSDPSRVIEYTWDDEYQVDQQIFFATELHKMNVGLTPKIRKLFTKIERAARRLGDCFDVSDGIIPYKTKSDAQHSKYTGFTQRAGWGKLLRGKDVSRYRIEWRGEFIKYGRHLWCAREERFFREPKILLHSIRNKSLRRRLVAALDTSGFYNTDNLINVTCRTDEVPLETLLALLNSKVINFWYKLNYPNVNINPNELRSIPINVDPAVVSKLSELASEQMRQVSAGDPHNNRRYELGTDEIAVVEENFVGE